MIIAIAIVTFMMVMIINYQTIAKATIIQATIMRIIVTMTKNT